MMTETMQPKNTCLAVPNHTVFLDCDGVLYDFMQPALRIHGKSQAYIDAYPRGTYLAPSIMGLTPAEFWRPIDNEAFWSTLPPYPGASDFLLGVYAMCQKAWVSVVFCSSSSHNVAAFAGARQRLLRNLCRAAGIAKDLPLHICVNGASKGVYGGPGHLLIDDNLEHMRQFVEAGGGGILVPMPWNTMYGVEPTDCEVRMDRPDYDYVLKKLREHLELTEEAGL